MRNMISREDLAIVERLRDSAESLLTECDALVSAGNLTRAQLAVDSSLCPQFVSVMDIAMSNLPRNVNNRFRRAWFYSACDLSAVLKSRFAANEVKLVDLCQQIQVAMPRIVSTLKPVSLWQIKDEVS